jgi:hypothetical protein
MIRQIIILSRSLKKEIARSLKGAPGKEEAETDDRGNQWQERDMEVWGEGWMP